jgi:hypothetical protein
MVAVAISAMFGLAAGSAFWVLRHAARVVPARIKEIRNELNSDS